MKLSSLEIKGFKSFADKTVINFNENITGIVGPNGCGKSNVVDSIRWVLGEQRTSNLRSEKMDNLIFNGSRSRQGAGLAEVSLTFENTKNILPTEYKQVTITRRLYRNGESEYRLNDVTCRLKDIQNLFMDTGVSSDSYAIIELGMMDEILNDRDNSRRKLFEQAAGVAKYKKRKKETLSKLESTQADLERVKDLLHEIEANLKTLESQAKRTQKYYSLKEDYKQISVLFAHWSLGKYRTQFKELEAKIQLEDDQRLGIETKMTESEAQLEAAKLESLEKEKALSAIQKKLNELLSGVGESENERKLLNEQIKYQREKAGQAEQQISESGKQKEVLQIDLDKQQANLIEEDRILNVIIDELSKLKVAVDEVRQQHDNMKGTLNKEKEAFSQKEKEVFELEKKSVGNKASLQAIENEINQNKQENLFREQELDSMKSKFGLVDKEKLDLEGLISSMVLEEEQNNQEIENLQQEIEKLKAELAGENRILDAKKNEFQLLKNMVESLEGFPESIKFLKKNAKWTEQAPLLTDVVYCAEKYRVTIESYLENYLNYYVVQNVDEAIMSVNLLSDAAQGRANFFILDEFNKYESRTKEDIAGAIHAMDILEIDPKYRKLVAYLLDKVYIIEESANISDNLRNKNQGQVFLSASGKYVRADFTLSGGAVGLFEGKRIGRAKNLEKLEVEVKELEDKTIRLNVKLSDHHNYLANLKGKSKKTEIDSRNQSLRLMLDSHSSLKAKIDNAQQYIDSAQSRIESLKERMQQIHAEENSISEKTISLRTELDRSKEALLKADESFLQIANSLTENSGNYNQKNISYHQQLNKKSAIEQQLQFNNKRLEEVEFTIMRSQESLEQAKQVEKECHEKLRGLESKLLEGYAEKDAIEKEVVQAEEAYYNSKGLINELDTRIRESAKTRHQAETLLAGLKEKLNELKLELSSMKERLLLEFKVDINDLINQEIPQLENADEIADKIQKTKSRIENFGEINPLAVEAYDEMKKRYDFITQQKGDLEESKKNLQDTIDEIENTARVQFLEAFNKVRDNFQKVFRSLFTAEDNCDLLLADPNNPLDSKIDIIAQPKGKKPQVIDQLSGGEKTLTATALLFSLYLLKPAPFCVFDEVDAPLDDANISKFNNIIREFSKDSQFIIVTHNKQTMSYVDVIYGVTMQEQGVSKMVPVDFRSLN